MFLLFFSKAEDTMDQAEEQDESLQGSESLRMETSESEVKFFYYVKKKTSN